MNKRRLFFRQSSSMASLPIFKNSLITTRVRSAEREYKYYARWKTHWFTNLWYNTKFPNSSYTLFLSNAVCSKDVYEFKWGPQP